MDLQAWQETRERYGAWWKGDLNGPILKIFAERASQRSSAKLAYQVEAEWQSEALAQAIQAGMGPAPHYVGLGPDVTEEERRRFWLDAGGRVALFQAVVSGVRCYQDGFIHFFPDLGSAVAASFLGVEPRFGSRSVLNESGPSDTLQELEEKIAFDPENTWWRASLDLLRTALAAYRGRFVVGFPNLGGALDTLASLRGTQNLLMDLVLVPELVHKLEAKVAEVWARYLEELHSVIRESGQQGTTSWTGIWGAGKSYPIQCDLSVMVSPGMFQEFAVPSLRAMGQAVDQCIMHYHAESPKKTLDRMLELEEIDAIQWSPGVHDPAMDDESWLPLYRKITERGKGLVLYEVRPDRVEWLVRQLPAGRLAMNVLCESEDEAAELERKYR
ncbi:MAG TPA: uroporphyrinogen decarboxylase family protein [Anaerolineae bacterium]|nr:uroporphyrinogen decarboxylase family protein [Anaerolineae bacterium]